MNQGEKELPKGWKWRKLGDPDIADVIMGQSPPSSTYNTDGLGLPFYQGKADFGDVNPTPKVWCNAPNKIAEPGDILLSVRAPVGPTNLVTELSCIGRGLAAIRGTNKAITIYIYCWFKYIEGWLSQQGEGSTFTAIGKEKITQLFIPIPPLPVQELIVQILQKADEIRRKRQEAVAIADASVQAIFEQMFGDLNHNPYSYPVVELESICHSITDGDHQAPPKAHTGIPFIVISNISKGFIDFSNTRYVPLEYFNKLKQTRKPQRNDILYSVTGSFGIPVVVDTDEDFCFQRHIALIRPNEQLVSSYFLQYLLKSNFIYEQAKRSATGTAQLTVPLGAIRKFNIPLPPLEKQYIFESTLLTIFRIKSSIKSFFEIDKHLFNSLLNQSFTGELTAEWEAANAEQIAAKQKFYQRLPQLVILSFLKKKISQIQRQKADTAVLVTALMKYVFLFQMEGTAKRRLYQFIPYHYGPFAKELYTDLETLQEQGLITVDNSDEDKTHISLLNSEAVEAELAELPDELQADIEAIINSYGDLDLTSLLATVYEKYPAYAKKSKLKQRKPKPKKEEN